MAELIFNAATVDPAATPTVLPPGKYIAHITKSEIKPTSAGTGTMLALTFVVLDGAHKGRNLWANLNIRNPNATAQEIAEKQLSAICHATGVIQLQQTEQLHERPLVITVAVRKATEQYPESNDIKGYEGLSGATPGASVVAPPVASPAVPVYQPAAPVYQPAAPAAPAYQPAPAAPTYQPAAAPPGWNPPPQAQAAPQAPVQAQQFQLPPAGGPAGGFTPPPPPFNPAQAQQAPPPAPQAAPPQAPQPEAPPQGEGAAVPPWRPAG